ncbi:MAG TPA: MDR family MFS transporter [Candidatus Limnocylindria bacterium]|nr:MDR family MFS transporter [Candidatus Limnocylindria bacterium]
MTSTAAAHDRAPIELPHRTRIEILIAVLLGIFLSALDQTIVGTALPRIVTDLNGNDVYTWAFTSYLVTATVSGPIYGKLSDIFGRRPIFIFGVGVFLLGSILCGLSAEMWQFIAFRGLQGLGAGALFPVALAIIGDIFSPSERGKYQGFFGAVFGLSSLIGPALGGLITDNVGWHWIFYVNVPIGAVVLYIIWRTLPAHHEPDADRHIDYLGASLFVAALVPILIGFTNKADAEWTDPFVGGLIGLGLALMAAFVWAESRAKEPILPLGLFRIRSFTASVIAIFLAAMGFFAVIVFLPRWYQVVAGASATESGYQILPLLFGLIVGAVGSGQIVARTGRYKALIFGALLLLAAGLFLLTNLRADTPRPLIWLWMAIAGFGIGPSFAVFTLVVQNAVPVRALGSATSSVTLFQQVGGTVGLAVVGSVFGSVFLDEVPRQLVGAGVPQEFANGFASGGTSTLNEIGGVGDLGAAILAQVPEAFRAQVEPMIPAIVGGIHEAFSIATAATFVMGIVSALLAAFVVLVVLPRGRIGEREGVELEAGAAAAAAGEPHGEPRAATAEQ